MDDDLEEIIVDGEDGNEKRFICNQCGKIFRAKWTLKYHQRVHTGEKPYTCLTCDRQFRQASHLKIHERTHSGERPYVCEACGRAFIDSSTMRRHAKLHKDTADLNEVMDDSVCSEETGIEHTEELAMEDKIEERCIEIAVSSASESSTQPISTNVVSDISQSEEANLVHVDGTLADDVSGDVGHIPLSKMTTLGDINWQETAQDGLEQMTYYIVPAPKEMANKERCPEAFENISF